MIQTQTILSVADNTSAKRLCASRFLEEVNVAMQGIGDIIVVAVKRQLQRELSNEKSVQRLSLYDKSVTLDAMMVLLFVLMKMPLLL